MLQQQTQQQQLEQPQIQLQLRELQPIQQLLTQQQQCQQRQCQQQPGRQQGQQDLPGDLVLLWVNSDGIYKNTFIQTRNAPYVTKHDKTTLKIDEK